MAVGREDFVGCGKAEAERGESGRAENFRQASVGETVEQR